jgi:hypothetical protein
MSMPDLPTRPARRAVRVGVALAALLALAAVALLWRPAETPAAASALSAPTLPTEAERAAARALRDRFIAGGAAARRAWIDSTPAEQRAAQEAETLRQFKAAEQATRLRARALGKAVSPAPPAGAASEAR